MKRIGLYLSTQSQVGGMYQYNLSMLSAISDLSTKGIDVLIGYSDVAWETHLQGLDLPKVQLKKTLINQALAGLWEIAGLSMTAWRRTAPLWHPLTVKFMRTACDLWIFPTEDPWTYRLPVRAIGTIHDLMHRYERRFPEVGSPFIFQQRERKYRFICRWAKAVLVDSNLGKSQVHASYGLEPAAIKVLPFTAPQYIYSPKTPPDFDKKYRLPSKYLFYPAHFWPHKNHQVLIEAMYRLSSILSDLKIVFTGAPKTSYTSTLEKVREMGMLDRVVFLDYVPETDMPELYRRARAMIMPTFFGPTNIPSIEAFATGCPAAVSNVYAMPEQVGDAALLFDPTSTNEVTDVIQRLWTDNALCADLVRKGFKRARLFTQANFNRRLHTIIEDVLSGMDGHGKSCQSL